MGSKTDYLENKVLDHIFGKSSFTQPTIYVALYTVTPSDSGGGTEVSGGSYARKQTAASDWNPAASGSMSNVNDITFATATADWGTIVAFALLDAASSGNMLYWGAVSPSKDVDSGDTAKFAGGTPGDLVITED